MFTQRTFWLGLWLLLAIFAGKGVYSSGTYNMATVALLDLSFCNRVESTCSVYGPSYPPVVRNSQSAEYAQVAHLLEFAAGAGIGGAAEHLAALSYAAGDDAHALALLENGFEKHSLRFALWREGLPPFHWVRSLWYEQQGDLQSAISDLQVALELADFQINEDREHSSANRLDYLYQQLVVDQSPLNATDAFSSTLYAACAADWKNVARNVERVGGQPWVSKDDQVLLERIAAWSYRQLGDAARETSLLASAGEATWDQWSIGNPYLWLAQRLLTINPYVCSEAAKQIFDWYGQVNPTSAQGFYLEGERLYVRRAYAEALIAFDLGYQRDPTHVNSVRGMAATFEGLGQLDKAVLWYQKAIQLLPQYGEYHARLARVYQSLDQVELAQSQFDEAIALSPEVPEFLVWAGYFCLDQNQLIRAKELFEATLKIDSESLYAQRGLTQIVNLKEK